MKKIVGVRFRLPGKIYFFDPGEMNLNMRDNVIVETSMGPEFGTVVISNREIDETKMAQPLKKIIKKASEDDMKKEEENKKEEKRAFDTCKQKIKEHKLEMNLVEAKYLFDKSKLIFYFTAEGRVDFRDLVKDLASIFRTRIELRQIGVRDQVKRLGGNGVCGRELCCCSFLNNFDAVSIKMAKEQNLSLNTSKITGNCGRLMCCLKYEQNVYEDKIKKMPHVGAIVKNLDGEEGTVESVEVLKEIVTYKFKNEDGGYVYKKSNAKDLKIIKDSKREDLTQSNDSDEDLKELEKIEKMDRIETRNSNDDEI
jgi:cell fate regulator YaaT (PSP1 superfamily)